MNDFQMYEQGMKEEEQKKEARKWLEETVSDIFMDFCYYDRKEDEEMGANKLRKFMDDGIISKKMMIDVFTKQIENEYNDKD